MLSGLLLVGLLAAVVAVCWRAPARALTEPSRESTLIPRTTLWSAERLGSVSVRYHGRTAHQWAMRYKHRTYQYQTVRRTLMASSSVTEALELAAATYGHRSLLWALARCETGGTFSPTAKNPTSDASGLMQFMPSTFAGTPYGHLSIWSPYASAMAGGWMLAHGRRSEWVC